MSKATKMVSLFVALTLLLLAGVEFAAPKAMAEITIPDYSKPGPNTTLE